jgi:D-alanyl-D-alanine carboxypeptidase
MLGAASRARLQAASILPEKIDTPRNLHHCTSILGPKISAVACLAVQHNSGGGDGIMKPRRFAQMTTALCGTVGLAGWFVASLAGSGSGIENASAVVSELVTATAADTTVASGKPKPIVEAALPNPSRVLAAETRPVQVATANTSDPVLNDAKEAVKSIEIFEECMVAEICIDQFLWALYQRTRKEDTIKVYEQRKVTVKVTVKKKRKTVTVSKTLTKTFTKLLDQDFTWKDPKAAEKAGMPMMDYVIGGMDLNFKLKLFHTLHAAEQAGLSPGITSAFRDDYRQSIASGPKAATDRSYHGGSSRGGYGHGLAADVVSVKGATRAQRSVSTEKLWEWIDQHGKEYGIGRPYLGKDPPHVAPIDGREYASRRGPKA